MYLARRWKRQPQGEVEIDWANPLTRGLTDFVDLRALSGRNIIAPSRSVTSRQVSTVRGAPTGVGMSFPGGTSAGRVEVGVGTDFVSGKQTWMVVTGPSRAVAGDTILMGKHATAQSASGWQVFFTSTTNLGAQFKNGGSEICFINVPSRPLQDWQTAAAVSFGEADWVLASNGRASAFGVGSQHPGISTDNALVVGDSFDTYWQTLNAEVLALFGWNGRALSAADLVRVTLDPWQLFRPRTLRIYSLGASGIPVLSGSTVIDIGQTSARPRVTITF
jgi:hypothetical protein